VLGPDGYGGVQVAPPEESISLPGNTPAHPWWEVYQPVSYRLTSRMGNRSQFAAMVTACHRAGVKVYADVVLNHMTSHTSGTGYAGTTVSDKYIYPKLYSFGDFHHSNDCPSPDGSINDYNSQPQVQECELLGLADLRTESDHVRSTEANYLNDLISLGVDGFRVDAAKHISDSDIAGIESKLGKAVYVYQEVMPGGAVNPPMYEGTGDVLEFTYGQKLKAQFQGNISNLQTFGQSWGLEPSASSVTFVDNHDTDRNGSTLSYKDGSTYILANVFHLAWGYGTPQVYSSFSFSSNDQSPPANIEGRITNTNCSTGAWSCVDRKQAIGGMVGWHNAVSGTSVADWWSDGKNAIAFSRGAKGFVAINNGDSAITQTFSTGLPAGRYCDVIHAGYARGSCSGRTIIVDGSGRATVTVAAKDAVAIDVNVARSCRSSTPAASGPRSRLLGASKCLG
jgi:alpha-amylase